jgi:hypothetical protein
MLAEPESKTFCAAAPRPPYEGMKKGSGSRAALSGNLGGAPTNRQIGQAALSVARFGCFRFDGVFLKIRLRSSALFACRNGANRAVFTYGLGKPLKYANSAGAGLALNAQSSRRRGSEAIVLGANSQSSHQAVYSHATLPTGHVSARRPACLPKQPSALCAFSFFAARTGTCRRTCRAFPSPADANDRGREGNDCRRRDRGSIASFAARIRTR